MPCNGRRAISMQGVAVADGKRSQDIKPSPLSLLTIVYFFGILYSEGTFVRAPDFPEEPSTAGNLLFYVFMLQSLKSHLQGWFFSYPYSKQNFSMAKAAPSSSFVKVI